MTRNLLFGAAYYPEYMPNDRLALDIQMMKDANMNVIRIAESTWSTLEPRSGEYDFSYIDSVLNIASEEGMQVIVGTPTYAIPSWLAMLDDDILTTTAAGKSKYGRRQNMNIMNPTFRFHAERVIRELIRHTAKHPTVIGFQIDNETKHYGTAGADIQALFKQYLILKFGTTERLNETFGLAYWSNSIHDWDHLPSMLGGINGGLASEFERFQRSLVAEYLAWQAGLVEEYKEDHQFVTHNFDFEWRSFGAAIAQDGYSYGMQPDINHYEASQALSLIGTDIYHPSQDNLTGAEIAYGGDSIRSLRHENYLVLECQAQAFKSWTPYPGQLRLQAYSHLASGANGLLYWNWHSIHNSFETYWKGVLSHDLKTNPTYDEACRFGAEWTRIGSKLIHMRKRNRVALLVDNQSLNALKWFPIDKDLSYNDVVRWMFDSLYEMNIECDVVDVNALDIKRYDVIVTPALYSATEETLNQLEAFVAEGGCLVSSFKSFYADEHLSVYHDDQPHILHECFQMSYNQYTLPGRTTVKGKPIHYIAELVKPSGAETIAAYEHKYWGEYSAITRGAYGEGHAYYIACYTDKDTLKEVYAMAIQDSRLRDTQHELAWPLTVRSGLNQENNTIHYVMNYSEEERQFACPYELVTNILDGQTYRKGETIRLVDWDLVILEETLPS